MFTFTTYGTWLRGDERGWVCDGKINPENKDYKNSDYRNLKYPQYIFDKKKFNDIGEAIGNVVVNKLGMNLYALSVNKTHIHFIVGELRIAVPDLVRKVKDAVRTHLNENRAIWTKGYDKRFCYTNEDVLTRINYVQKHCDEKDFGCDSWNFIHKF